MTSDAWEHSPDMPTRVLVVDDHTTFAELLTGALDRENDLVSVGFASSAASGVQHFRVLRPDVVVMDFHLPDANGISAAKEILDEDPSARVVLLTGDPTHEALERAAAIGVCAFLPKDGSLATVLEVLRHARPGAMIVHPSLLTQLGARRDQRSRPAPVLTQREREVLSLMAQGKDVRGSAKQLGISLNTGRSYVKSILAKLDAHSQLEAVAAARRLGLLDVS
ncbi:response regulator transcription factor [Georgenia yuyongxinii]|uniref:response regulator transcription factor n=1 Tax=Georgenia yuyongxinii TaxID=2589797 RepID=UPI001E2C43DE|nr:response regulator transcription factor [Georgenia yuyongxinii]